MYFKILPHDFQEFIKTTENINLANHPSLGDGCDFFVPKKWSSDRVKSHKEVFPTGLCSTSPFDPPFKYEKLGFAWCVAATYPQLSCQAC